MRNARAFPLLPAALASVPFGFVLVRVRVRKAAQLFIPPTPSWKRASIGGGDEDGGVGRRDSGDVGSGLCGEVDVGSSISPSPPT